MAPLRIPALRSFRVLVAVLLALSVRPAAAEPGELWRQIGATRLDPERAVEVAGLNLASGGAALEIRRGTIFPATPVGGRVVEMVFLGEAQLVLEPPDDIEAGQLELFTGRARLAEPVSEAVLVVTLDAPVEAIFARPAAGAVEPAARRRAQEVFERWMEQPERRLLGVEAAILRDALGDPFASGFFAGRFHSEELGGFLYLFEPDAPEQISLGQFVPLAASDKEKRKLARQLHRAQRKGRLIGLSVADLGRWDTWLSGALPGDDGRPRPGSAAFEPQHYELELSLEGSKLRLVGKARLHLRPLSDRGRVVELSIHPDLEVEHARLDAGGELFFLQQGGEVLVVLPEPPAAGQVSVLEVEYSGHLLDRVEGKSFALRSTTDWYPHAGNVDLATYEATFRWPAKLDLLAAGRRLDGGTRAGQRFEHRRLDVSTFGLGFEVGKFKILEGRFGHVDVTLAADSLAASLLEPDSRREMLATVGDALLFFEQVFGPYPSDELTVVTAPRDFSQSLSGFVTLSTLHMTEASWLTVLLGLEDRRTVIAHEIAHQWWGHRVSWQSYRDQWISEAMANYAAVLFARRRLGGVPHVGPTTGWQQALTTLTADGRPVESLGPLVLGARLDSSRSEDAYQAIVYKKGAVVLDMLARSFGEEAFLEVLRAMVRAVDHRPLATRDFLDLIEQATGRDLDGFARQFVYGTGLPEFYYDYQLEPLPAGTWRVVVEARQQSPYRYSYRVVERAGSLDVGRRRLDQIEVAGSALLVPIDIAVYDPARGRQPGDDPKSVGNESAGNVMLRTYRRLEGETTELAIELDLEPKELWLDRQREVFGRFFNQRRHPKRMLYYQGLDEAAAGRHGEAEALYRRALAAEAFAGPATERPDSGSPARSRERLLDARIHLELARLLLDLDRLTEARAARDAARDQLTSATRFWLESGLKTLEARLALRSGEPQEAFRLLKKAVRRGDVASTEGLLLFAIAACESSRAAECEAAAAAAEERGADVSLLRR